MNSINAPALLLAVGQILLAMTLVIALASIASMFLRRQPAARERLWRAALFGVLAAPLVPWISGLIAWEPLTLHLSQQTQPAMAGAPTPKAAPITNVPQNTAPVSLAKSPSIRTSPSPAQPRTMPPPAREQTASQPAKTASDSETIQDSNKSEAVTWNIEFLAFLLAITWAVGLLYQLARLAIGSLRCRHLLASTTPLDTTRFATELRAVRNAIGTAPPTIVVCPEARGPGVIGLLRSRIVLPAQMFDWINSEALVQVIIHEAAHIQRRDSLINLLQILASCLFWPHPLVHWLNHRLREAREEVCDNFVLAHTRASSYAETLLRVAQRCPFPAPSPAGLAMIPRRGSLEQRVGDLLDPRRDRATEWPWSRRLVVQAALLGVLAVVGLVRIETDAARADESSTARANGPTKRKATNKNNEGDQKSASEAKITSESKANKPIAQVTGQVLNPNGTPAESATVILLGPSNNGAGGYVWPYPIQKTKADKRGRYSFQITTPGQYRLWANLDGMTSRKQRLFDKGVFVRESGGTLEPVELKLHEAVTVRVLVKDAATGKPIPGATVDLRWNDLAHAFTTNESGVAVVQPLTDERWQFQAFAEGHAIEYRWLDLKAGKDAEATFVLDPGAAISGTVRSESGEPIAGATVHVNVPGTPLWHFQHVRTDKHGRYRVEHVPITKVEVWAAKEDYKHEKVIVQSPGHEERTDITLAARDYAGSVQGIVVDETGHSIAGATVQNHLPAVTGEPLLNPGEYSAKQRWTTTGPDGRFVLNKLFADEKGPLLTVRAEGYAPKKIRVKPGPPEDPGEVKITLESGHSIEGRVVDPDGNPIKGVTVLVQEVGKGIIAHSRTDKQGGFSFDSLAPEVRFAFGKKGYAQISHRKLPLDGENVVTVILKSGG